MKWTTHLCLDPLLRIPLLCHCWNARCTYLLSFMLLLQRTPVIRHFWELPRHLMPKFADILRVTAPLSFTAGATHSVTGATGVVPVSPSVNPAQAKVGEPFTWVFRTTGEKAKSYSFSGLPPGIVHSGTVRNAVSSIGGVPTTPGEYQIKIIGWEDSRQRGSKTPTYTLNLQVSGGLPPDILDGSIGGAFDEGEFVELWVEATGSSLTYQWYKDDVALPGTASQNPSLLLPAITPEEAGQYHVEVANGSGVTLSEKIDVAVRREGSWEQWQALHGIDDPQGDPDRDGLTHFAEYARGTDPFSPSPEAQPRVSLEQANNETTVVARFLIDPQAIDSVVSIEASASLEENSWTPLRHGESDVTIVTEGNELVVRVPARQEHQFLRMAVQPK